MGTISNARGAAGLSATGTPTSTLVSGPAALGVTNIPITWTDADIAYSFVIESTAVLGEGTLELISGTVTGQSDVTVLDGDGKDFEGVTLQPMATLYGILIERSVTPVDSIAIVAQNPSLPSPSLNETDTAVIPSYFPVGTAIEAGSDDITFTFQAAGDSLTVTVIGKST